MAETEAPPAAPETEAPPPPPAEDEAAKWKALARKHESEAKRLKGLEGELEKLRQDSQSEQEKAIDSARKEAETNARTEERARANRRILTAEIKAAAGTRLADPSDAVRLIDLDQFEVDDEGEVDAKALASAIDKLLTDKPYLGANGRKPAGDADQGARNSKPVTDDSPRGLIAAGLEAKEAERSRR